MSTNPRSGPVSTTAPPRAKHPVILRVSSFGVAGILSLLLVTSVIPPIVADQSDRAVVNAPVTLLTAPIDGDIDSLSAIPGRDVSANDSLARISNARLDRGTLLSLEEKTVDTRERLDATKAKKDTDYTYLKKLDTEIANQTDQLKAQFQSQIVELRARVAESQSVGDEKKALVDRQNKMVARDAASLDMVKPTTQQYSAAMHKSDAENAKLSQKIAQLDALDKGIYVGDDLVAIGALAQKRRDIDLDAKKLEIEERELSRVLADRGELIKTERVRLEKLAGADIRVPGQGKVLNVGVAIGRRVNAGDTIASLVDCDKRFVVAIFSYRQGQTMKAGTHVRIDGASFKSGIVTAVLPKTSDKVDERFAVPFPQTERRELYAIVTPDKLGETAPAAASALSEQSTPCTVGQWVTVTRNGGLIPSMSVTWRRLETLAASWSDTTGRGQNSAHSDDTRRSGTAVLAAAFRSLSQHAATISQPEEDWMPRRNTISSR